jgi:prepilin-type N-terminal cleavage/methylation domain-containing protein
MKNKNIHNKKGFTLIELTIVTAVILAVVAISLTSLLQSQAFQVYNNNLTKLFSLINNARSQAITGKAGLDFTDFDNDALTNLTPTKDLVTPAHYGVRFNTDSSPQVLLFSDTHNPAGGAGVGKEGQFNGGTLYSGGDDPVLDKLILADNVVLKVTDGDGNSPANSSIFFSPNYADITFENLTFSASPFLTITLSQNALGLCNQIVIHRLAGIPELSTCPTP